MVNPRLNSPYLTQGRNYPKQKIYYEWYPLSIDESVNHPHGQCDFFIDELTWYGKKLKMIRHNCLYHLGHGKNHSHDQDVITQTNKSRYNVGISLAWIQHIRNEFGERCW